MFPRIRLKHGAGPIRVLMLGIPVDGLTDAQRATLRDAAFDLEELADEMRNENGAKAQSKN